MEEGKTACSCLTFKPSRDSPYKFFVASSLRKQKKAAKDAIWQAERKRYSPNRLHASQAVRLPTTKAQDSETVKSRSKARSPEFLCIPMCSPEPSILIPGNKQYRPRPRTLPVASWETATNHKSFPPPENQGPKPLTRKTAPRSGRAVSLLCA